MRKFLNFVARDDQPVLTPPSEDGAGFEQVDVGDLKNAPNTTIEANYVRHSSEEVLTDTHEAVTSGETFHHTDEPESHSAVSYCGNLKDGHDITESVVMVPSVASTESSELSDGPTDIRRSGGEREEAKCPVLETDSEITSDQLQDAYDAYSERSKPSGSGSRVMELLSRSDERLRIAAQVLSTFACGGAEKASTRPEAEAISTRVVISALREIAETMVWADQHDPRLWDTFLECSIMPLLLRCLHATVAPQSETKRGSSRNLDAVSRGNADFCSYPETSQKHSSQEPLQTRLLTADRTREISPNSAGRQRNLNSHSEPEAAATNAQTSRRETDVRTRGEYVGEGATENNAFEKFFAQTALEIQSQVLQSLSIMIQSVFRQHSLLCLFSSNHINDILSFDFRFEDDEMLGYFMSAVKTIALKLDRGLLQLFFDPTHGSFPLYNIMVRFFDHREQMVRIAVRNVTLTIYALGDSEVLTFAARDESMYLSKTVELLAKLCGNVARAFELLMDDGREVRRTRSRTGIFRQKVRVSELTGKLEEIENLFAYLGDVASISKIALRPLVLHLLTMKLFSPFFRPLASRASPKAIQCQQRWRLTKMASETGTPALAVFDAAARCLLLACVLKTCRSSCIGQALGRELSRCTAGFEDRSALHGLKAMASDIAGAERVSFVSLCTIEAFILCDSTTKEVMRSLKYDFEVDDHVESMEQIGIAKGSFIDGEYHPEEEPTRKLEETMLMTLSEFEAPLTPSSSIPSTPTYGPRSPSDSSTPPKGLPRTMSSTSLSTDGLTLLEGSESGGILSSFQLGDASLREAVASVALVVRRREVRTLRVTHAICRVLNAVGSKTNNYKLSVDVSKVILDEIAGVMQSFLRNKRTTIVSIERMFENFRSIAEADTSEHTAVLSLEKILSSDSVPKIAADFPKGAGKRRRALKDDATPPTETEDAVVFFAMLHAYEKALENQYKTDGLQSLLISNSSEDLLSAEVRTILLKYNLEDSYLDKREALQDAASAVLRQDDVN